MRFPMLAVAALLVGCQSVTAPVAPIKFAPTGFRAVPPLGPGYVADATSLRLLRELSPLEQATFQMPVAVPTAITETDVTVFQDSASAGMVTVYVRDSAGTNQFGYRVTLARTGWQTLIIPTALPAGRYTIGVVFLGPAVASAQQAGDVLIR